MKGRLISCCAVGMIALTLLYLLSVSVAAQQNKPKPGAFEVKRCR